MEWVKAIAFVVLSGISIVLFRLAWAIWKDEDWIRDIRYRDKMREEYWRNAVSKPPTQDKG